MPSTPTQPDVEQITRLRDENEQLRVALESALDDNAHVVEDRDRLMTRVGMLARELQALHTAQARMADHPPNAPAEGKSIEPSATEEELRVAFEELQVLTEELEVTNATLSRANAELEDRVGVRTRELLDANRILRRTELYLNTLVHGIPQLVWRAGDFGEWAWSSEQWTRFTGLSEEASRRQGWLEAFHPADRDGARRAWTHAQARDAFTFEGRIRQAATGRYRHFQTRASPVRAPDGTVLEWLGTCTDVDDIFQLREQQSVLVAELQHRTRNLMAVFQALVTRTIRSSPTLDHFRASITDRLDALARVQGLLSRRGTQRVAFDVLLREELAAHVELSDDGQGTQVATAGPADVRLQSSLVQTFALALHELATNAVKYGALAAPAGRLAVGWRVIEGPDDTRRLHVDWRETGIADMPADDAAPRGGGYGRELIERALPYQLGATTSYRFTDDGVHCTIEVSIPPDRPRMENIDG